MTKRYDIDPGSCDGESGRCRADMIESPDGRYVDADEATEAVLACLNGAFRADPQAIHCLIINRVPCNENLGDHPYVVCERSQVIVGGGTVDALGLVNGAMGAMGLPLVTLQWSTDRDAEGRCRLLGFNRYAPPGDGG